MMKETTKIETTITTILTEEDIKRLIIEWLDDRHEVEWDFDFDLDAIGNIVIRAVRKIKEEG